MTEHSVTEHIDLLIKGNYVVTMNGTRDIIHDGAVAVRGRKIVGVGKTSQLETQYHATETIGGDRFVVTLGHGQLPHSHHRRTP